MRHVFVAFFLALPLFVGCQGESAKTESSSEEPDKPDPNGYKLVKFIVFVNGDITANGQPITLNQVESRLQKVKSAGGTVWYYRNSEESAHSNAMKFVQLVAKNQLPIKRSEKPDFSDLTDENPLFPPSEK